MLSGTPVQCRVQLWCFTELWSSCSMCRWILHRTNSEIPSTEWERAREKERGGAITEWEWTNGALKKKLLREIEITIWKSVNCPKTGINVPLSHTDLLAPGPGKKRSPVTSLTVSSLLTHSHQSLNTGDSDPHRPLQIYGGHIPTQLSSCLKVECVYILCISHLLNTYTIWVY